MKTSFHRQWFANPRNDDAGEQFAPRRAGIGEPLLPVAGECVGHDEEGPQQGTWRRNRRGYAMHV